MTFRLKKIFLGGRGHRPMPLKYASGHAPCQQTPYGITFLTEAASDDDITNGNCKQQTESAPLFSEAADVTSAQSAIFYFYNDSYPTSWIRPCAVWQDMFLWRPCCCDAKSVLYVAHELTWLGATCTTLTVIWNYVRHLSHEFLSKVYFESLVMLLLQRALLSVAVIICESHLQSAFKNSHVTILL